MKHYAVTKRSRRSRPVTKLIRPRWGLGGDHGNEMPSGFQGFVPITQLVGGFLHGVVVVALLLVVAHIAA